LATTAQPDVGQPQAYALTMRRHTASSLPAAATARNCSGIRQRPTRRESTYDSVQRIAEAHRRIRLQFLDTMRFDLYALCLPRSGCPRLAQPDSAPQATAMRAPAGSGCVYATKAAAQRRRRRRVCATLFHLLVSRPPVFTLHLRSRTLSTSLRRYIHSCYVSSPLNL
jgi:hypothetical protein